MRTERVEWFHGREVAVGGMVVGAKGWVVTVQQWRREGRAIYP